MAEIGATGTDPITIDDDVLVLTSVAEPDVDQGEEEWNAETTYAFAGLAVKASAHRKYKSLQDGNRNHAPPVWPVMENDWWRDIGATNAWAALDLDSSTVTVAASPLVYEFAPGQRISTVGMFGVKADTVRVEGELDGEVVYDKTFSLRSWPVTNWHEVFTTPVMFLRAFWRLDLPMHSELSFRLTFVSGTGEVTLGALVMGAWVELGDYRYDSNVAGEDLSIIERDEQGEIATLARKRFVPNVTFETVALESRLVRLMDFKERTRGKVAMWLPVSAPEDPRGQAMATLGIARRFEIPTGEAGLLFIPFECEAL